MILVTGAAGFIGSNFVKYLNSQDVTNIIVSDPLINGKQFKNLNGTKYDEFITPNNITSRLLRCVSKVFHFGANSNTTEWRGEIILEQNYNYSVNLIENCIEQQIPISYSSSASTYGNGHGPLNLYAFSKHLVDKWVLERLKLNNRLKIQGFKYFNVFGPNEWHKGDQASPFYKFEQQALETGEIKIFEGSENFKRDFVHVDIVCQVQWAMSKRNANGIFDLGSGQQMSFLEVAQQVAKSTGAKIVEIPFPDILKDHYQTNTLADMSYFKV